MIGVELVNRQPVSQRAKAAIERMREPVEIRQPHLLQLALTWIHQQAESPRTSPFPWAKYLPELQQEASRLLTLESKAWVASLFAPNRDEMEEKLQEHDDRPEMAWPILKEQLDHLEAETQGAENPSEFASLLAENLYINLREVIPGFGHPNPLNW